MTTDNPTEVLDALAARLADMLAPTVTLEQVAAVLRDAYDLGAMSTEAPHPPAPSTLVTDTVPPGDGLAVQTAHVITPDKIAEHGAETIIMAWVLQSLRTIAANGGDPTKDATISIDGMPDGSIVITGEGKVAP